MNEARRYRVLETLGRGGFGTVYRAELLGQGGFSKQVALKVLNNEGHAEIALRLRDEARILGLLHHRAVVGVDNLVRLEPGWAVVMEYVAGVDVTALIRYGPPPVRVALELIEEVASALHAAYATPSETTGRPLFLIHRDIKPSNIRITARGEVKILDFGVAQAHFLTREARTRATLFGSFQYMAPERVDGIDGPEGDIYSLGLVMAALLSSARFGEPPKHPGRHEAFINGLMFRVKEALVESGAQADEEARRSILDLVTGMVAFEPADRPTARDVERFCREWRVRVDGPWMRDWAEEEIPRLAARVARPNVDEALSGSILMEITGEGLPGIGSVLPPGEDETAETVAVRDASAWLAHAPRARQVATAIEADLPNDGRGRADHLETRWANDGVTELVTRATYGALPELPDDEPIQPTVIRRSVVLPPGGVARAQARAVSAPGPVAAPLAEVSPLRAPADDPVSGLMRVVEDPTDLPEPPALKGAAAPVTPVASSGAQAPVEAEALDAGVESAPGAAGEPETSEAVTTRQVPVEGAATTAGDDVPTVASTPGAEVAAAAAAIAVGEPAQAVVAPGAESELDPAVQPKASVGSGPDTLVPPEEREPSFEVDLADEAPTRRRKPAAPPVVEGPEPAAGRSYWPLLVAAVLLFALGGWVFYRQPASSSAPAAEAAPASGASADVAEAPAPSAATDAETPAASAATDAEPPDASAAPAAEPPDASAATDAAPVADVAPAPAPAAAAPKSEAGTPRATSSSRSSFATPSSSRSSSPSSSSSATPPASSSRSSSSQTTASTPSRAAAPEPTPVAATPEPDPVEEAAPANADGLATVNITGDAVRAWLVSSDGQRYNGGQVPAGTYELNATFGESGEFSRRIQVEPGQTVNFRCIEAFRQCR